MSPEAWMRANNVAGATALEPAGSSRTTNGRDTSTATPNATATQRQCRPMIHGTSADDTAFTTAITRSTPERGLIEARRTGLSQRVAGTVPANGRGKPAR
jgi:hypothetical protein